MTAPTTYLTDEVRAYIGRWGEPSAPFRVDAWGARRFAEATGDDNPRYQQGADGDQYAPPTLLGQNAPRLHRPDPPLDVPHPTGLVGSLAWDFVRPVRIGETVVARMRVTDIFEKQGSLGLMVFVVYETTFTDTDGEVVARFRLTRIRY